MTDDDLKKLHEATKIKASQAKIKMQIEGIKKCYLIQLLGRDEDGKRFQFDIQANDFNGNNIIEWEAKQFIDKYVNHLECKLILLQEQFDKL